MGSDGFVVGGVGEGATQWRASGEDFGEPVAGVLPHLVIGGRLFWVKPRGDFVAFFWCAVPVVTVEIIAGGLPVVFSRKNEVYDGGETDLSGIKIDEDFFLGFADGGLEGGLAFVNVAADADVFAFAEAAFFVAEEELIVADEDDACHLGDCFGHSDL